LQRASAHGDLFLHHLDSSSWRALISTMLGLALVRLMTVGIRLRLMQRLQARRERGSRQINERVCAHGSRRTKRSARPPGASPSIRLTGASASPVRPRTIATGRPVHTAKLAVSCRASGSGAR
jgi:hypothetical protein